MTATTAASPVAFGMMVDWTGDYGVPFIASMGLAGVGIVMSFFMRADRPIKVPARGAV